MFRDLQPPSFQPHQIVYLACDQSRLYTEVIEILVDRQLAWVRPLVLVTPTEILPLAASSVLGLPDSQGWPDRPTTPDLLWPLDQFCPALDIDFVALLATLANRPDQSLSASHSARVSQFTRRLWEKVAGASQADQTSIDRI
jgi:hypothetical protein